MDGWAKVKPAAAYGATSQRTFRGVWLKDGLKHVRLPSGTILTKYAWIDEYLEKFVVNENQTDQLVDEVMKELKR